MLHFKTRYRAETVSRVFAASHPSRPKPRFSPSLLGKIEADTHYSNWQLGAEAPRLETDPYFFMREVLASAKRFYVDVLGISIDRAGTEPFLVSEAQSTTVT